LFLGGIVNPAFVGRHPRIRTYLILATVAAVGCLMCEGAWLSTHATIDFGTR
jgi:hypothetical protein